MITPAEALRAAGVAVEGDSFFRVTDGTPQSRIDQILADAGFDRPPLGPAAIERQLLSLLSGKHSSLSISFNDLNAPNYQTVAESAESGMPGWPEDEEWVSPEEKQRAIANNSMWTLQWYPDTPIGFQRLAASSLAVMLAAIPDRAK
jgi:hypothetical protein